jgi:hypothetical protein
MNPGIIPDNFFISESLVQRSVLFNYPCTVPGIEAEGTFSLPGL